MPDETPRSPRWDLPLRVRDWALVGLFIIAVIATLAYAKLQPKHLAGETLGVLVLGGSPDAAITAVAAAGGFVLRDGAMPGSVIARAPDAGFVARLRAMGAGLVYRIDRSANCLALQSAGPANAPRPTSTPTPSRADPFSTIASDGTGRATSWTF